MFLTNDDRQTERHTDTQTHRITDTQANRHKGTQTLIELSPNVTLGKAQNFEWV